MGSENEFVRRKIIVEFGYDQNPFFILSISKDHLYKYKIMVFGITGKVKGRKEILVKAMRPETVVKS